MSAYQTPAAEVEDQDQKSARRGSKILALVVGFAVDFGLTMVGSTVVSFMVAGMLLKQGVAPNQLEAQMQAYWPTVMSSPLGYGLILFGTFTSFLGAYLAARIANHREYAIVTVLAVISLGLSLAMESPLAGALHWLLTLVGVGVIYLGAYVHVRGKPKPEHSGL